MTSLYNLSIGVKEYCWFFHTSDGSRRSFEVCVSFTSYQNLDSTRDGDVGQRKYSYRPQEKIVFAMYCLFVCVTAMLSLEKESQLTLRSDALLTESY